MYDGTSDVAIVYKLRPGRQIARLIRNQGEEKKDRQPGKDQAERGIPSSIPFRFVCHENFNSHQFRGTRKPRKVAKGIGVSLSEKKRG
jgi:hypothetical protein